MALVKTKQNKDFIKEKVRTISLNGAFGLSLDSIYPRSSWPPFLGLLNVDSSNKEHILCLDLLSLRPHFPPTHSISFSSTAAGFILITC